MEKAARKTILQILHNLGTATPRVDTLTLQTFEESMVPSSLICDHHSLRSVKLITFVRLSTVAALASLPNLERLTITFIPTSSLCAPFVFPALTHLDVTAYWTDLSVLFEHATFPALSALKLHGRQSSESEQWIPGAARSLNTLLRRTVPGKLQQIKVVSRILVVDPFRRDGLQMAGSLIADPGGEFAALVEPLLATPPRLEALQDVWLEFRGYKLGYTSSVLRAMAAAWPALTALTVRSDVLEGRCAGLECLVDFARNCPGLRTLELPVLAYDAEGAARALSLSEYACGPGPARAHALRQLSVGRVADAFPPDSMPRWNKLKEAESFVRTVFASLETLVVRFLHYDRNRSISDPRWSDIRDEEFDAILYRDIYV
ncbi:hypothetical protein C8Q76DRAFT_690897 [Earliella scabrosa]|nr:hypothetical protein C8Q76DRAFT_690897 [Earliella scabrosa]